MILLFNPPTTDKKLFTLRDEICFQNVNYIPFPIRLAIISAQLKNKNVFVLDCVAEKISETQVINKLKTLAGELNYFVYKSAVGIIKKDSFYAKLVKKLNPDCKIILIENILSPIYAEKILQDLPFIDVLILQDTERTVAEILQSEDFNNTLSKNNGIAYRLDKEIVVKKPTYRLLDLDSLPFMDYEKINPQKYSISYLVAPFYEKVFTGIRMRTTRDCPYNCPFCIMGNSPSRGYYGKLQAMTSQRVVNEIEFTNKNYQVKNIFFWDETFTINKKRTQEICQELIEKNIKINFRCLTRLDKVDAQLLSQLAKAGCKMIEYGLESGNEEIRKSLHKNFSNNVVLKTLKETKEAGIFSHCDIIIGMPDESPHTLKETYSLIKKMPVDSLHFTIAFPYPETEFYETAQKNNLLNEDLYPYMLNHRVRIKQKAFADTFYLKKEELEKQYYTLRKKAKTLLLFKTFLSFKTYVHYAKSISSFKEFKTLIKKIPHKLKSIFN